jgi:hypothetical protein
MSHKFTGMQEKLNDLVIESSKAGLNINFNKTKEIRINHKSKEPLKVRRYTVEQVDKFTYLGSHVAKNGGAMDDVKHRIQKT